MKSLLRPFPQGYWVTRNGTIVKLTADAIVWPNGTRERLFVDLETGFLEACAMTCLPTTPGTDVRRARFVASEIFWDHGDHWVEFVCDGDEDPRNFVLAEPSEPSGSRSEDRELSEGEESEEEAEAEDEPQRSSSGSFGLDSSSASSDDGMAVTSMKTAAHPALGFVETEGSSTRFSTASMSPMQSLKSKRMSALRQERPEPAPFSEFHDVPELPPAPLPKDLGQSYQTESATEDEDRLAELPPSPRKRATTNNVLSNAKRSLTSSSGYPGRSRRPSSAMKKTPSVPVDMTSRKSAMNVTMTEDFRSRFKGAVRKDSEQEQQVERTVNVWKVAHLARDLGLSADEIREAVRVFDACDLTHTNSLSRAEFQAAAESIITDSGAGSDVNVDALKVCCEDYWAAGRKPGDNREMTMQDFLTWYSRNRFNADLTYTREQRNHAALARKFRCTEKDIHDIKACFDQTDKGDPEDPNKTISRQEFTTILKLIMRLPGDAELPKERINFLWREIDTDNSGSACFEEFVCWWLNRKDSLTPYHNFYRTIRNLHHQLHDPPVHYQDL